MSLLDAAAYVIGETAVQVVGGIVGRRYRLDKKDAQRIGEYVVIGIFVVAAVVFTIVYS